MSGVVTAASVVVGAIGTGYSIYAGQQQQQAQKKALNQQKAAQVKAETEAKAQQAKSETAMNAANQKQPDMSSIMKAAQATGGSGTMLTGPGGVDPGSLTLGKSTLLGQ